MARTDLEKAKGALALQWVRAVRSATNDFRRGLKMLERKANEPPRVEELHWAHLADDDDVLFEIAKWLTDQVSRASIAVDETTRHGSLGATFEFSSSQRKELLAIRDRTRSPVYNEESAGVPLASSYVEHVARTVSGVIPGSAGFSPEDRASFLVVSLAHRVHSGFSALKGRTGEVLALLRRDQPDRFRRRSKAGEQSKLSADGILEALNELAGRPLGAGALTANAIAAAKRRQHRSKHTVKP